MRAYLSARYYERFRATDGFVYEIRPRGARHPLYVRSGTSDAFVMQQVFVERNYDCLADLKNVGLVIDCGANVGYTSAYFLSVFAECRVIAVEPERGNYAMLRRNLAAYGDRVSIVHAGVWSHPTSLAVSSTRYRDGREWSRQVEPCMPGQQPDVEGVSVSSLLANSGYDRISILKMDIEGAEAIIFSTNYKSWIDRVDAMAVELHDDSAFGNASEVFARAISGRPFALSTFGELTVCRRINYQ